MQLTDELDFGRCQLSVSVHIILWFFQLWEGKESNEMKVEKPLLKIWTIYGACWMLIHLYDTMGLIPFWKSYEFSHNIIFTTYCLVYHMSTTDPEFWIYPFFKNSRQKFLIEIKNSWYTVFPHIVSVETILSWIWKSKGHST